MKNLTITKQIEIAVVHAAKTILIGMPMLFIINFMN